MILAAGYGTRLRPLTSLRAKPALPVAGRPVIAFLLELLARHGVTEVMVNLHHLPETIEAAVAEFRPPGLDISYQRESEPLGTGGGIARARTFLCADDPALVLAGDMLLDADLRGLAAEHAARGDVCTLVLRRDPRAEAFGTIGFDAEGRIRRIGNRFDLGGECDAGLFIGVRILSPAIFDALPDDAHGAFEDLSDWLMPALARGVPGIRARILEPGESEWEPVGTLREYLRVNLAPPPLGFLPPAELPAPGTRLIGADRSVIVGTNATVPDSARLNRTVVWADEVVPEGFEASEGVFAGGTFYACFNGAPRDAAQK